ncbi:MAG: hypothetical protein N2Z81_06465 [Hydrogenothermaceae bacterium]|nr:hypothetical protein [Hydrogenothermaceae bacterium]
MEDLDTTLEKLKILLEEEKLCILNSLKDSSCANRLIEITQEKMDLLSKLSQFSKEEALEKLDKIQELNTLLHINRELIIQNLMFIEDLFEAIFETTKTYSPEGSIKSSGQGFINKKV